MNIRTALTKDVVITDYDGPVITPMYRSKTTYKVDTVRLSWHSYDGGKTWTRGMPRLGGPKIKKDGTHSQVRYDGYGPTKDQPEWLATLVIENAPTVGA